MKYTYLEIKQDSDGECVKRFEVTNQSERSRKLLEDGLNRNLNHNEYSVVFVESEKKLGEVK